MLQRSKGSHQSSVPSPCILLPASSVPSPAGAEPQRRFKRQDVRPPPMLTSFSVACMPSRKTRTYKRTAPSSMSRRCSVLTIRRDGHRVPPVRPEIPGTESPSLFRGRTGCWSQAVPQGQRVGSTSTKGPKAQAFRLPGLRSLGRLLSVRFLQQLHVSLADGDPATWIELVIHVSSCLTRNPFPPGLSTCLYLWSAIGFSTSFQAPGPVTQIYSIICI